MSLAGGRIQERRAKEVGRVRRNPLAIAKPNEVAERTRENDGSESKEATLAHCKDAYFQLDQ